MREMKIDSPAELVVVLKDSNIHFVVGHINQGHPWWDNRGMDAAMAELENFLLNNGVPVYSFAIMSVF